MRRRVRDASTPIEPFDADSVGAPFGSEPQGRGQGKLPFDGLRTLPAVRKCKAALRQAQDQRRGFTLIELLVVIAIIALLVAILMPTLSRASDLAKLAVCGTQVNHLSKAGRLHAADHDNHLPVAGWMNGCINNLANPAGLGDPGETKYTYFQDGGIRRPAPTSAALGCYLQKQARLTSRAALAADLQDKQVQSPFRCPAVREKPNQGLTISWSDATGFYWAPYEYITYGFNEAVMGRWGMWPGNLRLQGDVDKVRQPHKVLFFADAEARTGWGDPLLDFYNSTADTTLYDCSQNFNGGASSLFDFERHNGQMVVCFIDGHVQTINMVPEDGDMAEVGISKFMLDD